MNKKWNFGSKITWSGIIRHAIQGQWLHLSAQTQLSASVTKNTAQNFRSLWNSQLTSGQCPIAHPYIKNFGKSMVGCRASNPTL